MAFDTTIYTDVTKDDDVDGLGGFRFQAISKGIDEVDRNVITESLQHRTSAQWPDGVDEREHPPTAAYFRKEGRFYFARGYSTGRTVSGRRGNQLTQAVVTREAADIHPYRPAQLYAAEAWRPERATSKDAPQWFAPLEVAPEFEAEALLDWVKEDEWILDSLPAYLSMLQQLEHDDARIVVIVHDDLDAVMRWFAVGTLLLESDTALALGYRVFALDPFTCGAHLVGVHPELMRLHGVSLSGAHTIDVAARRVSDITITESSVVMSDWIRNLDPFDALEVIGVAQRWIPILGVPLGVAGAEMVTDVRAVSPGREEWERGIAVIEALAKNRMSDDLELYLDELADAVATCLLQDGKDFVRAARAARLTASAGIPELAQAIIEPTLEALARVPQHAGDWAAELNKDRQWQWDGRRSVEKTADLLADVIQDAPDDALAELLLLAGALGAHMPLSRLEPSLRRAAMMVLQKPERYAKDFVHWYGADLLRPGLRTEALRTLASPQSKPEVFDQLRRGAWDFLDAQDDNSPEAQRFRAWLCAGRLSRLPIEERAQAIVSHRSRLTKETWRLCLHGVELPRDCSVYALWLREVGRSEDLLDSLMSQVTRISQSNPETVKVKEVAAWLPVARMLADFVPGDTSCADAPEHLEQLLDRIPTVWDRASSAADSVKGLFGRHRGNGRD